MAEITYQPPAMTVKPKYEVANRQQGVQIIDVVFDIEATGFDYLLEDILSIAAVTRDGEKIVEEYSFPAKRKKIPNRISEMTGLELETRDGEECLLLDGESVQAVSLESALRNFIDLLKDHAKGGKINLMAHNCFSVDALILCEALDSCNLLQEFGSVVVSITDTDELFKKAIPELPKFQYKLVELARYQGVLPEKFVSHDALEDAKLLAKLLSTFSESDLIDSCTYTWSSIPIRVQYLNRRRELRQTLYPLYKAKILTKNVADRAADSGVGFNDLQEAFTQSGLGGLKTLLSDKINGRKARVTASNKTTEDLYDYFASLEGKHHSKASLKTVARVSTENPRGDVVQDRASKRHTAPAKPHADTPNSTKKQDTKNQGIGETINRLKLDLKDAEERIHDLELKIRDFVDDFDQHRFINSVRLFGIAESSNESVENVVMDVLQSDVKVSCSVNDIDFCHRVGRFQSGSSRPILIQFNSYRMKRQVMDNKCNLKGSKIVVCEELTEERLKLYYAVRDKVGQRNAWTNDGRIFARNGEGRICSIHSINDLSNL